MATFSNQKENLSLQSVYHGVLDTIRCKLPKSIHTLLVTTIILMAGISMNGDWTYIYIHLMRYIKLEQNIRLDVFDKFTDLPHYVFTSIWTNCGAYLVFCGYLQWYFYIRQRDLPEKWKCQPKKFLSWKDEKHEIILGTICSIQASTISGVVSCYVNNGGHCTLYYSIADYGFLYFILSIPLYFLYIEAFFYYAHRFLHFPMVYKTIHKYHHRYKQPTPFSAFAMHPLELLLYQTIITLPSFLVPIHSVPFFLIVGYNYYYGIINHSGIKMDSIWPWQSNTFFHDNHHQFFHVNFGLNTAAMDKFHGTYRKKDRVYGENIFYGRGKNLKEATPKELAEYENY